MANADAVNEKKSAATENLVSLQSINSNSILALQQNLNQNQISTQQQQPSHSNQNAGSKPQSLVNINYQTAQTNMQNQSQSQSQIQSSILLNNNYLDPSKFLVQKQYQVSFEIQSLLNSVDGTGMAYPQSQTPTQTNRVQVQQSVASKPKVYQTNQAFIQNQPMQQITSNPVKIMYAHDQVDSSKNQSLHQSLLHNALMSQFINNQNFSPSNQHNSNLIYHRNNIVSPLMLPNLQHGLGSMSAPVLGSNYTLKLSPTSTNAQNVTNLPELEIKPYPTLNNTQAFNLVSNSSENPVQNLFQVNGQAQQINAGIMHKGSFNSPIVHLAETAMPDQDISALGLDDQKLIQAVSIQNVLTQKIENSNDVLAQLGQRIKQILSEKVLDVNQISDYNSQNFHPNSTASHAVQNIAHQPHLNENVSCYSPSLSRRNSIDLKEKKNLCKPGGKFQPSCEPEIGPESAYLNDSNYAFILGLLGVNKLAQQNVFQTKAQPNASVPNATINRPNQPQSSQQYIGNHLSKQNDNFNQSDKNSTSSPNFEDLFLR